MLPFFGSATVATCRARHRRLSKIARVVELYARRLQVQDG